MELPDLTGPVVSRAASRPAPEFVADVVAAAPPRLFEVSPTAGVPEQVLAPARAAAQAAGYAAGWAHGIQAARLVTDAEARAATLARERAETQRAADLARALAALDAAATSLEHSSAPTADELEQLILAAAFDVAESLVGRTLRDDTVRGHDALARALALAPAGEDVRVSLNPADYAAVGAEAVNAASDGAFTRSIALVSDPALLPGDSIATCGATRVDARISAGLARVRALLAEPTAPATAAPTAATPPTTPTTAVPTTTVPAAEAASA